MLWTLAYRHGLAVIVSSLSYSAGRHHLIGISKLVIALSTTLVTSQRQGAFYILIVLTFVIICQLPNILVSPALAFSLNTETWGAATPSPHGRRSVRPSTAVRRAYRSLGGC